MILTFWATRLAGWSCLALLAVLSLSPAEKIVRTSLGGHFEHITAYAGAAALMALGYRSRSRLGVLAMLIAYAGLLEQLQSFSPGRIAQLVDFTFSAAGVLIGTTIGWGFDALLTRWRR